MNEELVVGCRYRRGVAELQTVEAFNAQGDPLELEIPARFRWVCKNPECCPRRPGHVAVHRFVMFQGSEGEPAVGTLTREYIPTRPLDELIDYLPPGRVKRVGPGERASD